VDRRNLSAPDEAADPSYSEKTLQELTTNQLKTLRVSVEEVLAARAQRLAAELASIRPKRTRGPNRKKLAEELDDVPVTDRE
jgi:hypothetical protein